MTNNTKEKITKDISELRGKIQAFQLGQIPEDKFKHFRLTRGVYGQRQSGVQMIRIKLPYGKLTPNQLRKIADASDKYATGNLHLTTRQDIQLHFVKLKDSPDLWEILEEEGVTLREACGNTVRNVTASVDAGIDPDEPFDITAFVHEFAYYFLRNPICQDMGRKFKVAFSSSEKDSALTYIHDLGFIARVKNGKRGFKVVLGGGLGAQPFTAQTVSEFIETDELIPFSEAIIRVFDRHGERANRNKARLKFLVKSIGLETLLELAEKERKAVKFQKYPIEATESEFLAKPLNTEFVEAAPQSEVYNEWVKTNVFEQKQKGYYGVYLRVQNGDIHSDTARKLAEIVENIADEDIRVSVNQGLLFRYVQKEYLPYLYNRLKALNLAEAGFDSTHDITSCPGSDTCNLAVTNSTELARQLEAMLDKEFGNLKYEKNIKIKISGCLNSCGQHLIANIGFHGTTIKNQSLNIPAMQVVLGGGIDPDGQSYISEKIIKVPTRKVPEAVKLLLKDFKENGQATETFNQYFWKNERSYFYQLLKPLTEKETFTPEDYIDWGHESEFVPEVGVGECAGIILDLVGTVINEAKEKLSWAIEGIEEEAWADSIYNSYSAMVIGAKALLLSADIKCNTQAKIISDFAENFTKEKGFPIDIDFPATVYQINENEASDEFAKSYFQQANTFVNAVENFRKDQLNKEVVTNYYKA
jgi:sulfite reductase (ferredoxin)